MSDGNRHIEESQLGKQRLRQVFQFLKELNQHRYPPKRQITEQKWHLSLSNLPEHPAVQLGRRTAAESITTEETVTVRSIGSDDTNGSGGSADFVLRVRRAKLTKCPQPPSMIEEWILTGWELPSVAETDVQESRNEVDPNGDTILVRFDDDPARIQTLSAWRNLRNEWRPARAAFHIYEQLSALRGTLQRESEKCDLVLGDGVLSWNDPAGSVFHPVLLQRVQLEFDPAKPEFTIVEADSNTELYLPMLNSLTGVDSKDIAPSRKDLATQALHPLMEEASPFLKELATRMFTKGEFIRHQAPPRNSEIPVIGRSPYLFISDRVQGYSAAIDKVLETIESRTDICSGLFKIVGVDLSPIPPEGPVESSRQGDRNPSVSHQDDILFGKFANQQQFEIATQLGKSDAVLVQGPPGTGKSHTIANLIGHLLAQNKSVLVTSHTTKALRVLRGHLAAELRPLCVSLLDHDAESREQLKESVQGITQRLSTDNKDTLNKEAERLADERHRLLQKRNKLKQQMLDARSGEYRDVVLAGESWTPSEAARFVYSGKDQHNWIPGSLAPGAPIPLSVDEVYDLYRTNTETTLADTTHFDSPLPVMETLPSPDKFEETVRFAVDGTASAFQNMHWSIGKFTTGTVEQLRLMQQDASNVVMEFGRLEKWQVAAVEAGRRGAGMAAAWEKLIAMIEETIRIARDSSRLLMEHTVQLNDDECEPQQQCALEIAARYGAGKQRIPWGATGKKWKLAIAAWKVSDGTPSVTEHFEAIAAAAGLKWQRQKLAGRWKALLAEHNGPNIDSFGPELEQTCSQYLGRIRSSLAWWETKVTSLKARLQEAGFHWTKFVDSQPPLQSELSAVILYMKSVIGTAWLSKLTATLCEYDHPDVIVVKKACNERDVIAYRMKGHWKVYHHRFVGVESPNGGWSCSESWR
jgi:DNA polymerase III delta prime subunit